VSQIVLSPNPEHFLRLKPLLLLFFFTRLSILIPLLYSRSGFLAGGTGLVAHNSDGGCESQRLSPPQNETSQGQDDDPLQLLVLVSRCHGGKDKGKGVMVVNRREGTIIIGQGVK